MESTIQRSCLHSFLASTRALCWLVPTDGSITEQTWTYLHGQNGVRREGKYTCNQNDLCVPLNSLGLWLAGMCEQERPGEVYWPIYHAISSIKT